MKDYWDAFFWDDQARVDVSSKGLSSQQFGSGRKMWIDA